MVDLAGKRIVITGAAGGIGSSLAARLHRLGARVALTSRSAERLDRLVADMGGTSDHLWARPADLTDEEQVSALFSGVHGFYGNVEALVNLAGLSIPGKITETSVEQYQTMWHANVTSAFLCCKHVVPLVDADVGAAIVSISSVAANTPNATAPLYCTTKAALDMFSKAFALQVRELGIRVTTLNPGGVDTAFWGTRPIDRSKLMKADDVVDAIEFVLTRPPHMIVNNMSFGPYHQG